MRFARTFWQLMVTIMGTGYEPSLSTPDGHPPPWDADPMVLGLACAAVEPGLRSVLLLDASPLTVRAAAVCLSAMLKAATGQTIEVVTLGSNDTEEGLWGSPSVRWDRAGPDAADKLTFTWQCGRLAQTPNGSNLRLVIIPDLTRLGLAARRACIALMGSDVATLQSHGQSVVWHPKLCWIAGCARQASGEVSPHLLDRFALRLQSATGCGAADSAGAAGELEERARAHELLSSIKRPASYFDQFAIISPDSAWFGPETTGVAAGEFSESQCLTLRAAAQRVPDWSLADLSCIPAYFANTAHNGVRREAALARLAQALAKLQSDDSVTEVHLSAAADLIGLRPAESTSAHAKDNQLPFERPADLAIESATVRPEGAGVNQVGVAGSAFTSAVLATSSDAKRAGMAFDDQARPGPVFEPDTHAAFAVAPVAGPYVEDKAPVTRDANTLRLPILSQQSRSAPNGPVIGTRRATDFQDLSLVSTVLEAAKFQSVRTALAGVADPPIDASDTDNQDEGNIPCRLAFPITRADLRSYCRAALPEATLVLLVDYTSIVNCDWQTAIVEHLSWAYAYRASVSLVQVGAASASNPLCARQVTAKSLLNPTIRLAIADGPGTATPLAHGLDLAARTLRSLTRHGRSRVKSARAVVLTDGRGNVPLNASRAGVLTSPVHHEGVEDALTVAREIGSMNHVECFLLNPGPLYHADLPLAMARAMKARVQVAVPLQKWEEKPVAGGEHLLDHNSASHQLVRT